MKKLSRKRRSKLKDGKMSAKELERHFQKGRLHPSRAIKAGKRGKRR